MSIVGQNIKKLREALGESQSVFGERFELTRGKIASYEATTNDSQPSFETVLRIVDDFNIDLRAFISGPHLAIKEDDLLHGRAIGQSQRQFPIDWSASALTQSLASSAVTDSKRRTQASNQEELLIRLQNRVDALLDMARELSLQIQEMRSNNS